MRGMARFQTLFYAVPMAVNALPACSRRFWQSRPSQDGWLMMRCAAIAAMIRFGSFVQTRLFRGGRPPAGLAGAEGPTTETSKGVEAAIERWANAHETWSREPRAQRRDGGLGPEWPLGTGLRLFSTSISRVAGWSGAANWKPALPSRPRRRGCSAIEPGTSARRWSDLEDERRCTPYSRRSKVPHVGIDDRRARLAQPRGKVDDPGSAERPSSSGRMDSCA